jgi:hypothetical protein
MNKIIALSPHAIQNYFDWLKIYGRLGQRYGVFLAKFPKHWVRDFTSHIDTIETEHWDEWSRLQLREYIIYLENSGALLSLFSNFDHSKTHEENIFLLINSKEHIVFPICRRENKYGLPSIQDLKADDLIVQSSADGPFNGNQLITSLAPYFITARKIVFVDRHNYLLDAASKPTTLSDLIVDIIKINRLSNSIQEIVIFAKYNPIRAEYMKNEGSLKEALKICFSGLKTPTYGIRYVCCNEGGAQSDLHARLIITNHISFTLTDSISSKNKSQKIIRISDPIADSKDKTLWLDEEHGLDIAIEYTFVNQQVSKG